jgi:pyroglutamyl-peptidase
LVNTLPSYLSEHPLPSNVSVASMSVLETSGVGAREELHKLRQRAADPAGAAAGGEQQLQLQPGKCFRIWLHFGVHAGSQQFALESTAYNCADFRCPDQRGWSPRNEAILPACAAQELCTGLDLPALRDTLEAAPFAEQPPAADAAGDSVRWAVCVSTDPGRFVCNWLFFNSLASLSPPSAQCHESALFVHVPAHDVYDLQQQQRFARQVLIAIAQQLTTQDK